jgi:orotate phosphoribosyltransferase
MMDTFKREFIEFSLEQGVLAFGEFVLKSGRTSPYFFNTGLFDSGRSLFALAGFYLQAIEAAGASFDTLYGPAYKGIPLAAAIACRYALDLGRDVPYCFNRKEAKDHGEGGRTVGAPLRGRVLVVDDVISAGTSARESIEIIGAAGAEPVALAIALDRQERGTGERSAVQEVEQFTGLRVLSVLTLTDLVTYLETESGHETDLERVHAYREAYGV